MSVGTDMTGRSAHCAGIGARTTACAGRAAVAAQIGSTVGAHKAVGDPLGATTANGVVSCLANPERCGQESSLCAIAARCVGLAGRHQQTGAAPLCLVTAMLLIAAPVMGLSLHHEVRGYVKEHATVAHERSPDWLSTSRLRTKARCFPSFSVTAALDYELAVVTGPLQRAATPAASVPAAGTHRDELLDLTWTPVSTSEHTVVHSIDRIFVEYYSTSLVVTVGRQRIAWGASRYFRPLDQFAPFAPAQVDKAERAGIDAVQVQIPSGRLTDIQLVYDPAAGFDDERAGMRCRTSCRGWDLVGVVGCFRAGCSAGGSLSGPLHGAGLHGEWLLTRGDEHTWQVPGVAEMPDTLQVPGLYGRVTVGAEYGLKWHNLTVAAELHYDGSGRKEPHKYDWRALLAGHRTSVGRYLAAADASMLFTPLLTGSATVLVNADDGSALLQPRADYSLTQQLDVIAGTQLSTGSQRTEYGMVPNVTYVIVAWHY